jgi:hypothetical protein
MRDAALRPIALFAALVTLAGCSARTPSRSNASPKTEALAARAEQRDMDIAIAHVPHAKALVDSYHIEGEILTFSVDAPAWNRLGADGQVAIKHALWRSWQSAYKRRHPQTTERIFVKVEDLQGNDLGSYFE